MKTSGKTLNKLWNVNARHALYHKDSTWYHLLNEFPAALFDSHGYILFETERDLRACPGIAIGDVEKNWMRIPQGIYSLAGYVRVSS
jgi:hypothetical protein